MLVYATLHGTAQKQSRKETANHPVSTALPQGPNPLCQDLAEVHTSKTGLILSHLLCFP